MQTSTQQPDAATADAAEAKQCIKRIRARLERWELDHLRALAASLHEQLEAATARAESAEHRLDDQYRFCEDLQQELMELAQDSGATVGLTMGGALVVEKATSSVDFGAAG